ncbi:MAG: hypothetical protein RLZZ450_271 [Pseudomonadota bacterium]
MAQVSTKAFKQLQKMFREGSGIELGEDKRPLVQARLGKRLVELSLESFDDYGRLLASPAGLAERQTVIDLLTTNETYFFREPTHFDELAQQLVTRFRGRSLRIWSAASSTGEEAYSIAMTLLDKRPAGGWELLASDLSARVLEVARRGVYVQQRLEQMPPSYLKRFCMRGTGDFEGTLRVSEEVRKRVQFFSHNLLHDARALGRFDVVILRNVLIYFDADHKQAILSRVLSALGPGGLLYIGHSESLQGLHSPLRRVERAVYEMPV